MKNSYPNFRTALREFMRENKITNEVLASRVGAHAVTISKLLNNRMNMTQDWMDRLSEGLGKTAREIWSGNDDDSTNDETDMFSEVLKKPLPIYGLAAASPTGRLVLSEEPIEWIPSPRVVANVRGAYGAIVDGTSMEPRYEPGDKILINPHTPIRQGDYVIIQELIEGGTCISIKQFIRSTEEEIITLQFNPPMEIRFNRKTVSAMHRVFTTNEILSA